MEKLSWTDLRKLIAQRIHTDEKEVGAFMSALAPAIIKALKEDRQVKITNFGTFKLQTIAPRKSVNVATGEAFTLPGYDKLTFSPESSVRELIGNLHSTPAAEIDESTPLKKLDAQATEIVGLLSDLGQTPTTTTTPVTEDKAPEQTPAPEAPEKEEPIAPEPPQLVEVPVQPEPVKPEPEPVRPEPKKEEPKPEPKKKNRTWLVVGITVLVFAILLALAFLFIGNKFVDWVNGLHDKEAKIEVVEPVIETPVVEEVVEEPASTLPYPLTYKEFIAREYLPRGSRLAWLATKYYGNRDLWVFIYEANKNVVEHPSLIQVGTLIKVPKLPAEMMDFSNPELQELVDRLAEEYKKL
ncbi:MAG: HU family DNA-binding protein [Paludibacteraceae bacterium]|nr:HU family DNA-binding protein [Paludibacteraceae bacterium]